MAKRPERAWVDAALKEADSLGIPVWIKRNVRAVFPDLPAREELPKGMTERLDFAQAFDANYRAFVARLMGSGWTKEAAEAEWERLQEQDDESGD